MLRKVLLRIYKCLILADFHHSLDLAGLLSAQPVLWKPSEVKIFKTTTGVARLEQWTCAFLKQIDDCFS